MHFALVNCKVLVGHLAGDGDDSCLPGHKHFRTLIEKTSKDCRQHRSLRSPSTHISLPAHSVDQNAVRTTVQTPSTCTVLTGLLTVPRIQKLSDDIPGLDIYLRDFANTVPADDVEALLQEKVVIGVLTQLKNEEWQNNLRYANLGSVLTPSRRAWRGRNPASCHPNQEDGRRSRRR